MIARRSLLALPLLSAPALAQGGFPRGPVRLIVPFAAGTGSDAMARILAHEARTRLPQPMVVENRGGAGGVTGTEQGARAAPDGHTLTVGTTSTWVTNPALNPRVPYDFARDFVPVSGLGRSFYAIVTANTAEAPATLAALLDRLRARPREGSFASSGAGTITHLATEVLLAAARVEGVHVPYRGSGPALADVAGGQVLFAADSLAATLPLVQGGALRMLAVTAPARHPAVPTVPTLEESGFPGLVLDAWFGVAAPAGTPTPVLEVLGDAVSGALRSPEALARFAAIGAETLPLGPVEFASFVQESANFWRGFLACSGIRLDF